MLKFCRLEVHLLYFLDNEYGCADWSVPLLFACIKGKLTQFIVDQMNTGVHVTIEQERLEYFGELWALMLGQKLNIMLAPSVLIDIL